MKIPVLNKKKEHIKVGNGHKVFYSKKLGYYYNNLGIITKAKTLKELTKLANKKQDLSSTFIGGVRK